MQVLCHHPVPIRWRPPRMAVDRHAYLGVRTPVELPEAIRAPEPVEVLLDGTPRPLFQHEGTIYARLVMSDLIDCSGKEPITPRNLALALESNQRDRPGAAFRTLTPLRGSQVVSGYSEGSGEDLPTKVLAHRIGTDVTSQARIALARYVAQTFLVDGEHAYVRQRPSVITPHTALKTIPETPPDAIGKRGYGLHFEPSRLQAMQAYLRRIGYRNTYSLTPEIVEAFALNNDTTRIRPGDDLALWINEGPWYAETLAHAEIGRAALHDIDLAPALAHAERLRPYVDLGLVGAIAPEDFSTVAELLGNAIDALRAALPDRHTQPPLSWMKAYSDIVAKPAIGLAPVPEEDMEDLAGLVAMGAGR